MLTTLSALPAEDTENHHHTTIKKKEGGAHVKFGLGGDNRIVFSSLLSASTNAMLFVF